MSPEEAKKISSEIEDSDLENEDVELTEEELAEIEAGMSEDGEFNADETFYEGFQQFGDEEPENDDVVITETYTVVKQPVITVVEVDAVVGADGKIRPSAKLSITRHLETEGDSTDVYEMIGEDFANLSDMMQDEISNLKKSLNKAVQ